MAEKIKSTNGIWHSRYQHEDGYGDTLHTYGQVNVVDGRVFIDSISLAQYFTPLNGKVVGFELVLGLARLADYEIDAKIKPLVAGLQRMGVRTLHSCEGHLKSPDDKYDYLCPQVDFPKKDAGLLAPLPDGWALQAAPYGDAVVVRLRPQKDATTEDELIELQNQALLYAAELEARCQALECQTKSK